MKAKAGVNAKRDADYAHLKKVDGVLVRWLPPHEPPPHLYSSATTCTTLTCTTLTCSSTSRLHLPLHLPLQVACEDLPFFQRSGRNAARRRTMNMDIRIDGIRLCAGKQARPRLYLRRDLTYVRLQVRCFPP